MSLLPRITAVLLIFGLVGCGFHPLYGDPGYRATDADYAAVEVGDIPGHEGQLLVAAIEDRLNPKGEALPFEYKLNPTLDVQLVSLSFKEDGTVTRYKVKVSSAYTLIRLQDNKQIDHGILRRSNSYNVSDADYSTFVAQQDSIKRAIESLGEKYFIRLSAFFAKNEHKKP